MGEQFTDQILTSLKIIGRIKEGQKVCVRDGLIHIEVKSSGVVSSLKRWLHGDNRFTTLSYIKNVVNNALDLCKICSEQDLKDALRESILGLSSLAVTYGNDAATLATIEVLQERIKKNIAIQVNGVRDSGDPSGDPQGESAPKQKVRK
tara:strand:+ start:1594 stop:2040 length:447 start_codon:yes stop_codon:yes gene_type:complete